MLDLEPKMSRPALGKERTTTSFDKRLGARVRAERLAQDMSQEALAAKLGLTFQQLQKYEKGVNRIAASRLADIAIALETPLELFFEGIVQKGAGAPQRSLLQDALAAPGAIDLVMQFAAIKNSGTRRRVLELVRAMGAED